MLTSEQKRALDVVAAAFGWDKRPEEEMRLIMWSAFHYYATRLKRDDWIRSPDGEETIRERPEATLRAGRGHRSAARK